MLKKQRAKSIFSPSALMAETGQLSQQGLWLLHNYYAYKHPAEAKHLFIVNHARDIKLLSQLIPIKHHPVAYILDLYGHKTPIIQFDKTFIILDSKGRESTFWRSQTSALKEAFAGQKITIYASVTARQSDNYSCGTDALLVSKAALRMNKALLQFVRQTNLNPDEPNVYTFEELPTTIAKYSQQISYLQGAFGKKGLLDKFPELAQVSLFSSSLNRRETIYDYLARHQQGMDDNTATLQRREKYRNVLNSKASRLTHKSYNKIVTQATGIQYLLDNPEQLIPLFRDPQGGPSKEIYQLIGIYKQFSHSPVLSVTDYSSFKDPKFCNAALLRLESLLNKSIKNYSNEKGSLAEIAKIIYARFIVQQKISHLSSLSQAPSQSHIPAVISYLTH